MFFDSIFLNLMAVGRGLGERGYKTHVISCSLQRVPSSSPNHVIGFSADYVTGQSQFLRYVQSEV